MLMRCMQRRMSELKGQGPTVYSTRVPQKAQLMFSAALEARYEYVFPLVLSETLPICTTRWHQSI